MTAAKNLTTAEKRKSWSEKGRRQSELKRGRGLRRIAGWITREAYTELLTACEEHETTISGEITAVFAPSGDGSRRVAERISAEAYSALLATCKARGTTFAEELSAALVLNKRMRLRQGNKPL
jgi:hypothetical protein